MRRLIELIGSCSHFLREINPSMQSVSINQVKTQTEVSEAETKQAFVWCFLIEERSSPLCYHHLYVLTSSITDVLETTEKKSYFKEKLLLEGAESDSEDTSWIISGSFCRLVFVTFKLTDCKSSSVSVNSFLSFCSRSLPQNEANSQRETAAGTKPRLWNQTTFLSWGKTSGETPAEP